MENALRTVCLLTRGFVIFSSNYHCIQFDFVFSLVISGYSTDEKQGSYSGARISCCLCGTWSMLRLSLVPCWTVPLTLNQVFIPDDAEISDDEELPDIPRKPLSEVRQTTTLTRSDYDPKSRHQVLRYNHSRDCSVQIFLSQLHLHWTNPDHFGWRLQALLRQSTKCCNTPFLTSSQISVHELRANAQIATYRLQVDNVGGGGIKAIGLDDVIMLCWKNGWMVTCLEMCLL